MNAKSRRRSRSVSPDLNQSWDRHGSRRSRSQERKKRRERSRSGSRHRSGTGLGNRAARRQVRSRSGSAGLRRSTSRSVSRRRSRSSSARKSRSSSGSRDGLRRSRSKSRGSPAKRSQSRSSSRVRSGSRSDSDSGKSEGSRCWRRERKKASPTRERRRSGSGDRRQKRKARKHKSEKRETKSRRSGSSDSEREYRRREGREKERESSERQRKETESREEERVGREKREREERERESIERQRKETESRERERKERESHEQKNHKEKRDGERSVRKSPERQKRGRREKGSGEISERERACLERGKRERGSSDSSERESLGRREVGRGDSSERERGRRERRSGDSSERQRRERRSGDSSERQRRERGRGDSSERERERPERGREKKRGVGRSSPSGSSVTSGSSESQSRSPGSSSSSGSGSRGQQQRKQETRAKDPRSIRQERHAREDILKAMETPEEKRARRLAKKEAKERKKREKMGWSEEYMGYTNADNPFGDNNLLGTFKWQKALELKGIGHLGEKDLKERNKHIQEENRRELQKVKQLRLEREREKAMREQELEMLQREKEAEHFKTWAEQEDNFHLHQAKLRSKIRIRDGRAKPIDLLAKYISAEDDDLAVEMHEPYTFLNGLTVYDMDDLLEDIKVYMELEQGKNGDFWRDMTIITEDEISKLRKLEASGRGPGDRREGINTSVSTDVQTVFKGKTYNQLQALHQNIEGKIRGGGSNLDIGYWESLMQQVKVYMARARLRERHQDVLRQKLYKLKQEQGVESEPLFPIVKQEPHSPESQSCSDGESAAVPGTSSSTRGQEAGGEGPSEGQGENQEEKQDEGQGENQEEKPAEGQGEAVLTEEDLIQQSLDDYDSGRYSPSLLQNSDLPLDTHLVEPEEDLTRLQVARKQMQVTGDASESAEDAFVRRARQGMGGDEAQFSVEMPLTGKVYLWADKYRPRKPRFFNRVHTGFEWNKYNQTHYDFDNPPPKIVQGYKFNIFYPDLIDKRSTPQYFLEPSQDNRDFGVLRFHAGPPYEDIAFKIVNREWEYSHRHGFRCQFANGIFQLWFHFKRYRYRR
ncbi:CATIN protein, partial [Polyodon spathula]|nr:cactin-like [Polyodon spathula]MBN3282757.1 CATIN protein [Polyodon spathula]